VATGLAGTSVLADCLLGLSSGIFGIGNLSLAIHPELSEPFAESKTHEPVKAGACRPDNAACPCP
jgi:hypothetical protein